MGKRKLRVLCVFDLVEPASSPDLAAELETPDWVTEKHVLEALRALGHEVSVVSLYDDLGPLITACGGRGEAKGGKPNVKPDVVFNLTEQFGGDRSLDRSIAGILDLLGVPYTGSGPMGLGLARDKVLAKKILTYHHIRVPDFVAFPRGRPFRVRKRVPYPVIVKPIGEDASEGIARASLVRREKDLAARVRFVHESMSRDAIAEEYVEGREIFCSILGNDRLRVLPLRSVWMGTRPGRPKFFTYRLKWDTDYQRRWGLEFGFAVDLPDEVTDAIGRISKRVYRALEMRDYARIDLRVTHDGKIHVLEANPNPYLARREDFAESAQEAGIDYEKLIDRILNLALKRAGK